MIINEPEPFVGFHTFYSDDQESCFVAPVADMTVEEFIAEANRMIKEEWGQEDDYRDHGYPFTVDNVGTAYVVFKADLEYDGVTGFHTLGKKGDGAIECYQIDLQP